MADARARRRPRWIIAGALLSLLLTIDTVAWAWVCRRLDGGVREAAASAGWSIEADPPRWRGWPLTAELAFTNAALHTGPAIVPPIGWTVPRLALRLHLWSPTQVTASADGAQTLAVGAGRPVPFSAAALTATIDLTAQQPLRIDGRDVAIGGNFGPIQLSDLRLLLPPGGWFAAVGAVTFPGRDGRSINPPIDRLEVSGRIDPPVAPMPTARESAEAWRARDGHIAVDVVRFRWGALDATAHATLTLDKALQPAITGTITTSGLAATLAQLADNGAITSASSTAAQAMITILAAPAGGGQVTLPVTVQDNVVDIARIPLLRLAPLQWD